jgi:hypothetical protein
LCEIVGSSTNVDLAIAYWGANGGKTLGLDLVSCPVRILCDVYTGACNPKELEALLAMGFDVRTRNGLHAKVIVTSASAIVGSANASANGLGQEGEEANNIEAAALITNPAFVQDVQHWFNELWKDAHPVTSEVIQQIRPFWEERRRVRPTGTLKSPSLLGMLRAEPEWFADRKIRLVVYKDVDVSKMAKAQYDKIAPKLYHPKVRQKYEALGELPFYEDDGKWDITDGEYIVDYTLDKKKQKAFFGGLWRVRSEDAFHIAGPGSRIILCDKVRDFKGLRLNAMDGKLLGKFIFEYVTHNQFKTDPYNNLLDWPFEKAAKLLPS